MREDQARRRLDLPVRLRRRQGRHGRAFHQTKGLRPIRRSEEVHQAIAFNVIPHIDVFMEDGYTKEEWKMVAETKKILDPKIKVTATCVRVPVFVGHSEAVNIEFEKPITADEARDILREAPGVLVVDKHENGGYITPIECAGEDATYISPHPRGRDGRERPRTVGRLRQPAQGRGAQRGPDRRMAKPRSAIR
jgi:aspartate-semialdehyde dehydrogenase